MSHDWTGRRRPPSHYLYCGAFLLLAGCSPERLDTTYGICGGAAGASSVNGTGVLAGLFRAAGHRVFAVRRISPRLGKHDVVVWAPDDWQPPSLDQRTALEYWLQARPRTLVYVGRDFDASWWYWNRQSQHGLATEIRTAWRERARALAADDVRRAALVPREFARWFTMQAESTPERARQVTGASAWLDGLDPGKLEIYLGTRLLPSSPADALNAAAARTQVLLSCQQGPLVTRVTDASWPGSQILVVANGSFLLNLPLVNREHRKLAGKLVAACGSPGSVAFLETTAADRTLPRREPPPRHPTGFEAFAVWPLGAILAQALLPALLLCFALFPIFGPTRRAGPTASISYEQHVAAVGALLERTRDQDYARRQLEQYHRWTERV